jgi:hypothetical protein
MLALLPLLLLLLYNQLDVQTCLLKLTKAENICTPQLLQCR